MVSLPLAGKLVCKSSQAVFSCVVAAMRVFLASGVNGRGVASLPEKVTIRSVPR